MTYTYTIRQPFAVTREHHELPIDPAFIKMCGLKEGLAPSEYGLAMIYLQAASYGEWVINALIDVDGNLANAGMPESLGPRLFQPHAKLVKEALKGVSVALPQLSLF